MKHKSAGFNQTFANIYWHNNFLFFIFFLVTEFLHLLEIWSNINKLYVSPVFFFNYRSHLLFCEI